MIKWNDTRVKIIIRKLGIDDNVLDFFRELLHFFKWKFIGIFKIADNFTIRESVSAHDILSNV